MMTHRERIPKFDPPGLEKVSSIGPTCICTSALRPSKLLLHIYCRLNQHYPTRLPEESPMVGDRQHMFLDVNASFI